MQNIWNNIQELFTIKTLMFLIVGAMSSAVLSWFEQNVFSNWHYLQGVFMLVVIDTFLGLWVSYKQSNYSDIKMGKLFEKIALYAIAIIAFSIVENTATKDLGFDFMKYVTGGLLLFICVAEIQSIIRKLAILGFPIPAWITKRFEGFSDTGKFEPINIAPAVTPPIDTLPPNA